jgi:hypothetical protein
MPSILGNLRTLQESLYGAMMIVARRGNRNDIHRPPITVQMTDGSG